MIFVNITNKTDKTAQSIEQEDSMRLKIRKLGAVSLVSVIAFTALRTPALSARTASIHAGINAVLAEYLNESSDGAKTDSEQTPAGSKADTQKKQKKKAQKETAASVNGYQNLGIANVDNYVNIRETADESARIVGKLPANAGCEILSTADGWYQIRSGEVSGYVKNTYLITGKQAAGLAKKLQKKMPPVSHRHRERLRFLTQSAFSRFKESFVVLVKNLAYRSSYLQVCIIVKVSQRSPHRPRGAVESVAVEEHYGGFCGKPQHKVKRQVVVFKILCKFFAIEFLRPHHHVNLAVISGTVRVGQQFEAGCAPEIVKTVLDHGNQWQLNVISVQIGKCGKQRHLYLLRGRQSRCVV